MTFTFQPACTWFGTTPCTLLHRVVIIPHNVRTHPHQRYQSWRSHFAMPVRIRDKTRIKQSAISVRRTALFSSDRSPLKHAIVTLLGPLHCKIIKSKAAGFPEIEVSLKTRSVYTILTLSLDPNSGLKYRGGLSKGWQPYSNVQAGCRCISIILKCYWIESTENLGPECQCLPILQHWLSVISEQISRGWIEEVSRHILSMFSIFISMYTSVLLSLHNALTVTLLPWPCFCLFTLLMPVWTSIHSAQRTSN